MLAYVAGGLIVLLVSYNLLTQALPSFPAWQVILASLAVGIILLRVYTAAGLPTLLHYVIYASIYGAGGVVVQATALDAKTGWPAWQVWLIYTGLFSLVFLVVPPLIRRWVAPPRDLARYREIAAEAEEAHMRREAALTLLPSHSWYVLACWVTGIAMIGSFATTAIGFYSEIVDPYAYWLIRFGVPIGLSAMAAFIIWSGWNFVFLRMRIAKHVWTRSLAFALGLLILVPLTLAIHTVFGIIGVGGTEGLRQHYTWYSEVLSRYQKRADDMRAVEAGFVPLLDQMGARFKKLADDEVTPAARARCGAGQAICGAIFRTRQPDQLDSRQIAARRDNSTLPKAIEAVRKEIRDPGKDFALAQEDIDGKFAALRADIVTLQGGSVMSSIQGFMASLRSSSTRRPFSVTGTRARPGARTRSRRRSRESWRRCATRTMRARLRSRRSSSPPRATFRASIRSNRFPSSIPL